MSNHTLTVIVNNGLAKDSRRTVFLSIDLIFALGPVAQLSELIFGNGSIEKKKKNHRRKTPSYLSNRVQLRALYDFQARTSDEISFKTDEILILIDDHGIVRSRSYRFVLHRFVLDPTWWRVASNGKIGLSPLLSLLFIRSLF